MKQKKLKLLSIILLLVISIVNAQETVVFNINNLANGIIEENAGSLNSCWLLDSDIHRPRNTSNEARWAEMSVGAVRYPYGIGENYLWDTPPFGSSPLVPKVGSMDKAPGTMAWATNPDGTMNKIMDFDEFMAICQRQNIKPLVVVSTQSHKYIDGPTYEELKTTAVEWVKYAKLKGYEVAYWQIGNEVDGHTDILPEQEYFDLYVDFVSAMKAADPTIVCGLGIKRRPNYVRDLMARAPELVDFASAHQYLTGQPYSDYDTWLAHDGSNFMTNILGVQNAVNTTSNPDLPILVTETNAHSWAGIDAGSQYQGLAFFDMLMTQQSYEDVVYSFLWSSHSPWGGEFGLGKITALDNDIDNRIRNMGWSLKIFNTSVEERFMIPDNKVHGVTYSYGSYTPSTGKSTIYLLNKSASDVPMTVNINNYNMSPSYERWVWAPEVDQYSIDATYRKTGRITQTNSGFTTNVPPFSVVVVKLNSTDGKIINPKTYYVNSAASNNRVKSDATGTDVISTTFADDQGWLGKWNFIDAGDGYYYIECKGNSRRLQANGATGTNGVLLTSNTNSGNWVKWKLTKIGDNYFIDNKAHNLRLSSGSELLSMGSANWTGTWSQWKITDALVDELEGNKYYIDNVGANSRIKSNTNNTDAESTTTNDSGWRGKWKFVYAGDGYYYIENMANKMRLQGTDQSGNAGVKIVANSDAGWVKWNVTKVGNNYYIDNKAYGFRLSSNAGQIVAGNANSTSNLSQWKLVNTDSSKELASKTLTESETAIESSNILMYPTSIYAGEDINLHYTSQGNGNTLNIRVIDISGKVIKYDEEKLNEGVNKLKIESKGLSQGLYFVELSSRGIRNTKKIVVK